MLSRAFLGTDLTLFVTSAIILCYHFTSIKSAVHTEGTIVDAVQYNNHSNDVDDNGSWYPVVASRPTSDYTLTFNLNIGSDFHENSEGDRVNVYYPSRYPEQAEINNPWVNSFKWGFAGIAGIVFGSVGLIATLSSTKKSRKKWKPRP